MRRLRAATRGSALALWQTRYVGGLLNGQLDEVVVETTGDKRSDVPITALAGRGVFVKEVQAAVLEGRADIAVHSAKDLPSMEAPGLVLAAVPERGDPRDAMVGARLDDLPLGARVATGAVRRRAQLAALRGDLLFFDLRGNVDTRLVKAAEFDAIVVAAAALERLGRIDRAAELLPVDVMVPQVAQGALAIECRADDYETIERLQAIEHATSRMAVDAERAFLDRLGGGCTLPVGAYAVVVAGLVELTAIVATLDGTQMLRHVVTGPSPVDVGREACRYLIDDAGGAELLAESTSLLG